MPRQKKTRLLPGQTVQSRIAQVENDVYAPTTVKNKSMHIKSLCGILKDFFSIQIEVFLYEPGFRLPMKNPIKIDCETLYKAGALLIDSDVSAWNNYVSTWLEVLLGRGFPLELEVDASTTFSIRKIKAQWSNQAVRVDPKRAIPLDVEVLARIFQNKVPDISKQEAWFLLLWVSSGLRENSMAAICASDISIRANKRDLPISCVSSHFIRIATKNKIMEFEGAPLKIQCSCKIVSLTKSTADLDSTFCVIHNPILSPPVFPVGEEVINKLKALLSMQGHNARRTCALMIKKILIRDSPPRGPVFDLLGWSPKSKQFDSVYTADYESRKHGLTRDLFSPWIRERAAPGSTIVVYKAPDK